MQTRPFRMIDDNSEVVELGEGADDQTLTPNEGPLFNTKITGWCS
jgi:hypothetical protein